MKEVLLLKCGEIVLKGLNRKTFEDRLLKNLKRGHGARCRLRDHHAPVGRLCGDSGRCRRRCGYGVRKPCVRLCDHLPCSGLPGKDARECHCDRKGLSGTQFCGAKTFKVESKRGDKKFPMTSTGNQPARRRRAC